MVKVSGVPYDVELPTKEEESKIGMEARAYYDGLRFGIESAVAYLEFMHEAHKQVHNYYKLAAIQLKEKLK